MRARSVGLAGILAAAALLGGCAEEEAPSTMPKLNEPTVRNPSEDSTEASEGADDGSDAHAFMDAYFNSFPESFRSQDGLDARRSFFQDSCSLCLLGWEIARDVVANNQTLEFDGPLTWTVEVDESTSSEVRLRAITNVPAATVKDSSGRVVREFGATPNFTELYLLQSTETGSWSITQGEGLG